MPSNYTFKRIIETVCRHVNVSFGKYSPTLPEEIFCGKRTIPLTRRISRMIVVNILHNSYGVKYREIAAIAGISIVNAMRWTRVFNQLSEVDDDIVLLYNDCMNEISVL